jgi:hypothetical protein
VHLIQKGHFEAALVAFVEFEAKDILYNAPFPYRINLPANSKGEELARKSDKYLLNVVFIHDAISFLQSRFSRGGREY